LALVVLLNFFFPTDFSLSFGSSSGYLSILLATLLPIYFPNFPAASDTLDLVFPNYINLKPLHPVHSY
jgi:hypothetical protein